MTQIISDTLVANGTYKSPDKKANFLKRKFATCLFLFRIFGFIHKASRLSKKGKYCSNAFCQQANDIIKALENVNVKFSIEDAHIIKTIDTPCVYVANHMSTLETFILPAVILPFQKMTFVIKQSLLKIPAFKNILNSVEPVAVSQKDPREDLKVVLEECVQKLEQGTSVVVFPQGKRTSVFDAKEFNSIGIKIAKKANVPVVPIALQTDAWTPGKRFKELGKVNPNKTVRIHFGKPMNITGNGKQEHATSIQFIEDKLTSWNN